MQSLLQNLSYAIRQFRKSPGFTLTIILTLALGIGANAAVFALFDQVLLRMLPVEKPRELVRFEWTGPSQRSMSTFGGDSHNYFSYPIYKDLRDLNQVLSGVLAARRTNVGISWRNQAEDEDTELVSGNYFQVLGLRPALGRLLTPQDDTAKEANPVAVLGYDYWKTRFAASHDIVGQTILVNGHPFTILGVAPQNFRSVIGGYDPGIFLPLSMSDTAIPFFAPNHNLTNRNFLWLVLAARLRPGVTAAQAEVALAPLWHSLHSLELPLIQSTTEAFNKRFLESRLTVKDDSTGFSPGRIELKTPLIILMSMAGLLIAMCAINVATLLLLRASARAREIAMRYALGAGRSRIISQLLVEGGLLGLTGALAGLLLAPFVARALVQLMIHADPGSEPYSASIDGRILLFTLGISLLISLLFSIAPILHFLRPDLVNALRQGAGTASRASQRFRKAAVGLQIALSVVLLGGAGLFVRTLDNLRHQPVGFETSNLATFYLDPTSSGYGEDRVPQIMTNTIDAIRHIPGVTSVAATDDPELLQDTNTSGFAIQGYKPAEDENINVEAPWITPGYFATLHQPLLAGREFTDADTRGNPKVAVVNQAFAKHFFGSVRNALGHSITEGGPNATADTTVIVGVVGDTRHTDLRTPLGPAAYRPWFQQPHPNGAQIYARTLQSPETVELAIRKTMHELDPALVVDGLRTMEVQIDRSASGEQALAVLAVSFSALAMILAAVGLYGVLSYSTEQRTREIGVRLALGAPRSSVVFAVIREMALIAAIAIAAALPSITALARLFRSQLYGVTIWDPLTQATALLLTVAMALLAAALPARRAASVNPIQALRAD